MRNLLTFVSLTIALAISGASLSTYAAGEEVGVPVKDFAGEVRLLLPNEIYAVPGVPMNIYFDNVVLVINPANYAFDITCRRGSQLARRWAFTPKPEDVGSHPLVLEVRDQSNAVVARASTTIEVVSADSGAGQAKSVLMIGDSLTSASVYSDQVLKRCLANQENNPVLKLIGTRETSYEGVTHEGYGGWTAERFATKYSGVARGGPYRECGSPFLYKHGDPSGRMLAGEGDADDGAPVELNFGIYCEAFNGGKAPDFVTILLGCNDTFHGTDADIESRIDVMLAHYETLLKMIHDYDPAITIGAQLLVPPAASQDAFGANYQSNQTRWQYKRNQHRVVERMMAQFGGRENDNVFLIPSEVNLDCERNYPIDDAGRQNNGVHPAEAGYRQIGDSVYAWMKAGLGE